MRQVSQREIAEELGLSRSTVSRAIHNDPRLSQITVDRVMEVVRREKYVLDPVVSAGLSRVRHREFYRETIAWIQDVNREETAWMKSLFNPAHQFARDNGYKIEHVYLMDTSGPCLNRLIVKLEARGIRGVILGPMQNPNTTLDFPWEKMSWVMVGNHQHLHSIQSDKESAVSDGLQYLLTKGYQRPGFVYLSGHHYIYNIFRKAAANYYFYSAEQMEQPLIELWHHSAKQLKRWVRIMKPDCLIAPATLPPALGEIVSEIPKLLLDRARFSDGRVLAVFQTYLESIGQSAVNLLHQRLSNNERGIPQHRQTLLVNPVFSEIDQRG